jgi:hypothetical protein
MYVCKAGQRLSLFTRHKEAAMDRRNFTKRALTSVAVATAGSPALAALASQPSAADALVRNPVAFAGTVFTLENGTVLTLVNVTHAAMDRRLDQWTLQFQCNQPITEGIHRLRSPQTGQDVELFLQPHGQTAMAYISKLATP